MTPKVAVRAGTRTADPRPRFLSRIPPPPRPPLFPYTTLFRSRCDVLVAAHRDGAGCGAAAPSARPATEARPGDGRGGQRHHGRGGVAVRGGTPTGDPSARPRPRTALRLHHRETVRRDDAEGSCASRYPDSRSPSPFPFTNPPPPTPSPLSLHDALPISL